jgi:hypothetical protein
MRQSNLHKVIVVEHYMHLMSTHFYAIVDEAVSRVRPAPYVEMFGHFVDEYRPLVDRSDAPAHYRRAFAELGETMQRWSDAFR